MTFWQTEHLLRVAGGDLAGSSHVYDLWSEIILQNQSQTVDQLETLLGG